jgi:AcrR family transcriptional regulator
MKNTKEVILNTALELFNSEGLSKVTLRSIANKMKISQGNLNYHFNKREVIIETLYFQLVKNIDENISDSKGHENVLEALLGISNKVMYEFYEYRFFLLDFVQIIRENKVVREHYFKLTKQREQQFAMFFSLLIEDEIMRKEILPNEYKNLYKRLQILGDFWISSAETESHVLNKKVISKYSKLINQAIFPYLTAKGQKQFVSIVSV